MKPYFDEGGIQIYHGDCRAILPTLPAASVHSVVTSPPYFGLRDYGGGAWVGGDDGCDHKVRPSHNVATSTLSGGKSTTGHWQEGYRTACGKCGATRQDQQIGLESTPAAFVAELVGVFDLVRRVLRSDGTAWVVLGDSFSSKQQLLIPHRVALALQDAGWWLRSTIVWHKLNAMPSSVQDRPTDSHEYIFLLAQAERYFYDAAAIAERSVSDHTSGNGYKRPEQLSRGPGSDEPWMPQATRNRRSVWTINSQPTKISHFAVFPEKLVEPMILAGCPAQVCLECLAPWVRQEERLEGENDRWKQSSGRTTKHLQGDSSQLNRVNKAEYYANAPRRITTGWQPTCSHDAGTEPGTVLDPFSGSGTVGVVAKRFGRKAILIEQNESYCRMAANRIEATPTPLPLDLQDERQEWQGAFDLEVPV